MKQKVSIILSILLPIQVGLVAVLKHYPAIVEQYYSNGIFPIIALIERYLLGWLPFSGGDVLYFVFALLLIRWGYKRFKTRFRQPKKWGLQALSVVSVLYFCFHFFWGLNYYRLPLNQSLHIGNTYSSEELVELTQMLIKQSNSYQEKLSGNDSLKVEFPFTPEEVRQLAIAGYHQIATRFPQLDYRVESIKPSLYSLPLTYMGFSGYINPLTNEAQVNSRAPAFSMPSITAHEIGHQLGYAKENEANFMAVLNLVNHPNPYFRYAGYTFALQYCLGDLYRSHPQKAKELATKINWGVYKNYQEVTQFWASYQNPLEPVFKLFYGHYLKANNQPKGMRSYNYVVALMVNYFDENGAF